MLFKIKDLTYKVDNQIFFNNFNLEINRGEYVSIISPNASGKTMLTKLICAVIPTTDFIELDGILLNKENVLKYITKIGIISNEFNNKFLCSKVKEELMLPLKNLGYKTYRINKKIKEISKFFEIEKILNKDINTLSQSLKSKLLIIISLLHEPKLLVLDDAFNNMNASDKLFMLTKLKDLNEKGLTILNVTSKLDTIYDSSKIMVMKNFKIEKNETLDSLFEMDSYLQKIGLEIPPIIDLSIKLKTYDLINKIYFDTLELEKDLWK